MAHTFTELIQLSLLGTAPQAEAEVDVEYEHDPESGDGFYEQHFREQVRITAVQWRGLDLLPALKEDAPSLVKRLEKVALEHVRGEVVL